jgi:hypothetical protein
MEMTTVWQLKMKIMNLPLFAAAPEGAVNGENI